MKKLIAEASTKTIPEEFKKSSLHEDNELPCCHFATSAIFYNPFNRVVQCHACGHIYLPANKIQYFLNRIFRWWG